MAIQNGTSSADYKVPNGKLLRVIVTVQDGLITKLNLNGDYFMHPESAVEDIEAHLIGLPLKRTKLEQILMSYIEANNIEIIGADPESIIHTLFLAVES